MKRILAILLIVYTFCSVVAQNNHVISVKGVGGCFFPMGYHKNLLNKPISVVAGVEVDYDFLSFDNEIWKKHWNYPSIGVSFLSLKLDGIYGKTTPSLGYMIAAYPHVNIPLYRSDIGQLRTKLGMGVAAFTRKSPYLGSFLAFNFGLSLNGEIYLPHPWAAITIEATYNPITNGNIYTPNSSMNIIYAAIGYSGILGYDEHKLPNFHRTKDLKDSWAINLSLLGGIKNVNLNNILNSTHYTLHIDYLNRRNNCWTTGVAVDVIYFTNKEMRVGVAWANGFTVNRITGLIDAGMNMYDSPNQLLFNEFKFFSNKKDYENLNGTLYMRLGMRCRIYDNLYVQISGRSFLHAFDCAEFGVNYSFSFYAKKNNFKEVNAKKNNRNKKEEQKRYIDNSKNKQENEQDCKPENRYTKQYEDYK